MQLILRCTTGELNRSSKHEQSTTGFSNPHHNYFHRIKDEVPAALQIPQDNLQLDLMKAGFNEHCPFEAQRGQS